MQMSIYVKSQTIKILYSVFRVEKKTRTRNQSTCLWVVLNLVQHSFSHRVGGSSAHLQTVQPKVQHRPGQLQLGYARFPVNQNVN